MTIVTTPAPTDPVAPNASAMPRAKPSVFARITAGIVALISAFYLINPTAGLFEFLPDNLPLVGNLDEAFFTLALLAALGVLGIELPFFKRK